VEETAALDIGARVVSWDSAGKIRAVSRAGARVAKEAGVRIAVGDTRDHGAIDAVADRIADLALRVPLGNRFDDPAPWPTEPLVARGPFHALVFSGGVGEYINGWEKREFGDLGLWLGRAIARRLEPFEVLRPVESIRATCIGASQYCVQVSGDCLCLSDRGWFQ